MRRTMLFVPGNNPGMLFNGCVLGADSVIFDLEDAISLGEKDSARILVRNALETLNYNGTEIIIRINAINTSFWQKDLDMIIPKNPNIIMPPKIESKEDIIEIENYITKIEERDNLVKNEIKLIPLIESALGVENAFEIAKASSRVVALFLGAEDLTANLGAKRTVEGKEIFYSRSRVIIAAKAANIQAIDTPYTDINDEEGLIKDSKIAKDMGFDGKAAISPRHVEEINKIFTPSYEEIEYSRRVIEAIEKAEKEGKGVISLDGQMIDAPIVERAKYVISIFENVKGGRY
ncbi:MAG: CoA ester lyase [Firmicutes bacterium]|nr:CoA ester lyase [Bacillota bacterium]